MSRRASVVALLELPTMPLRLRVASVGQYEYLIAIMENDACLTYDDIGFG